MKIMFYTGGLNRGGAERVIVNLTNYLSKNHELIILTDLKRESKYQLSDKATLLSLDDSDQISKHKLLNNFKRLTKIKKIVKEHKPNIIITFLPLPSFRMLLLKRIIKVPIISSVRNDPNREYNNLIKKIIANILYSRADGLVFQTDDAKNWFPKYIRKKSVVIPNPLNEDFICAPFNGEREKTIVTVGRLAKQKNHKLLIDAFAEVFKNHNDYTLKIYGSGTLENELRDYIEEKQLTDNVLLMGETSDVKGSIYKAKIFVLSSDYEGMPNSLMEAMALGLPCISTDCPIGGPKFLINNNENGILVETNNKLELINAINYLIENKDSANMLGNNAKNICKSLNPDMINKRWEEYTFNIIKISDSKKLLKDNGNI